MENLDPPPQSRMEKGQVLAFARLHPGPTVPLHSIQG